MDYIVHVRDVPALVQQLKDEHPELVTEEGEFHFPKTPSVTSGVESLFYMRDIDGSLAAALGASPHLTLLGDYDEVMATPNKRATYNRIYKRTPVTDEDGNVHTPPERFGVFFDAPTTNTPAPPGWNEPKVDTVNPE